MGPFLNAIFGTKNLYGFLKFHSGRIWKQVRRAGALRLIEMTTFNDRKRFGSAAAILKSFCLLAQFRTWRRMQGRRSMFSMRVPGIAIRNIGSVRGRPLFQAQKHNEFQGPISDAKRKLFQIWFVRYFLEFYLHSPAWLIWSGTVVIA